MARRVKERDISEIRTFLTCRRKWQLAYRECIHPVVSPLALAAGSIFHTCAELVHSGRPHGPKLAGWVAEKLAELDALPDPDSVSWDGDMLVDKANTLDDALDVYGAYHRENPEGLEIVAQEQRFEYRVPGTSTRLIGRIDGVARTADGNLVVLELKTAGKRYNMETAGIDLQLCGYGLAMRETTSNDFIGVHLRVLYTGSDIRCQINKDGTPSTSASMMSDAETLGQAIEQCKVDLMAEREIAIDEKSKANDALQPNAKDAKLKKALADADKAVKKIDTALLKLGGDTYDELAESLPYQTQRSFALQTHLQTWDGDAFAHFLAQDLAPLCKAVDKASTLDSHPMCGASQFTCNMCQYKALCVGDRAGAERDPLFDPDSPSFRFVVEPERHHYLGGDTSWLDEHRNG